MIRNSGTSIRLKRKMNQSGANQNPGADLKIQEQLLNPYLEQNDPPNTFPEVDVFFESVS